MINLLVAKEYIKNFCGKHEVYLVPVGKLILAFITILTVNGQLGYMSAVNNVALVLMIALFCSFMPINFIVVVAAGFILLHFYAVSLEFTVLAAAIFLLMFLLYFRFTPKDTLMVLVTPLLFALKIPYVAPIAAGLLGGPFSMISVGCGVVTTYMIRFANENIIVLSDTGESITLQNFAFAIDELLQNKEMIMVIIAFSATIIVVNIIKRLPVAYAWTIAVVTGVFVDIVILLIVDFTFDLNFSILGMIVGGAVAAIIGKALEFFLFNLDYNRTEVVQFEDDEYYFYVKAVPKITVATKEKKVKKINPQKNLHGAKVVRTANGEGKQVVKRTVARRKPTE
ncbi:MAG: hypothetical protein R3Y24_07740 [Eubacteriales bacterium]